VADTHNFVAGNVIVHNSNISESIRWALGEQSPKALRGHRMEDVIFHGSASRKPLGMAEVSLIFANDGTLSVPWGEVQVSRRLYRDGESEYLLNKNGCRLRDILDLFVGTGANPKAYALMDQERLNHVLTARPIDRRALIEEAAGISRYKQQRAETLGKLDAARQNLLRVKDVMDEVKRQLGSLERQARKAKQYKALQAEKQSLALALLAAEHASLLAQERDLGERMRGLGGEEDALRVKLAQLSAREAAQRARIQEAEHRLGDLRQAVQKVQVEVERLLERREQLDLQLREMGEEDVRLQEEARLIAERRAGLATERETKARALSVSAGAHREHGEAMSALTRQLDDVKEQLQSARERLETLRLTQVRVAGERSEMTRTLGELREREHQLLRRHERLGRELDQCRQEARDLSRRRASLEAERAEARAALALLEEDRRRLAARAADAEAQRAEAQAALERLRLALAGCQSSLQALEQLEREREGYGEGVRAVFSGAAAASVRGIMGTVADLLNVPRGFETAVEAVLGERLTWVVVERFEDAKTALAFLKHEKAGPATFLPLETLPSSNGLPNDENGARWAARLVESSHANLLHYLLGRVAIVSHLSEAEALWRRNGQVATYVTLSGEVLSPTGRLSGGRTSQEGELPATSLLGRKRAIRDAALERERLGLEIARAQSRLDSVEAELGSLREQEAALLRSIQSEEVRSATGEQDLARVDREVERVTRHLETLAAEERELLAEVQEARQLGDRLEHDAAAQRGSEESLERSSAELRGTIERLEADEGRLAQAATAARVDWASLAERLDALKRELEQLDGMDGDLSTRLAQSEERRRQVASRRAQLEQERERAGQLARDAAGERDRLEADERAATARHQSLLDEFRETEALIRASEQTLNRLREELHAAELRATEGRVRREELEQTARRSFGAEPEVLPQHHHPERNLEEARRRLGELEEKLLAMGAVNLVADEEYRELEERLEFLRTQHEDLVASIKDLEKALRSMTSIANERFQEAFEAINHHFGEIFARLFEGGRAELRLIPPEEGEEGSLDTGVDLMAQPRGKRLQSVTLLSGGEKALTGLALLFAIFYHRPSPFCVLDEVDAPLDDANIHRFLRVLRELSGQTQFVVITHNRKTMEAADVLYGITMEEPGLSRLVSVKLAEDHS
jgi:chromosome segregation protein